MKAVIMYRDTPQVEAIWEDDKLWTMNIRPLTEHFDPKVPYELRQPGACFRDFMNFLESRCVPRNRINLAEILKRYNLKFYDPLGMCLKSYGRSVTDFLWIDFNDSGLHWEDIKIRSD